MQKPNNLDYFRFSETPGGRVKREAVSMPRTRYASASGFGEGRGVLELGCGAGMGLRYLGRDGRRLIAGDYTESMLRVAKRENLRVHRIRLDAQKRGPCWFGILQNC